MGTLPIDWLKDVPMEPCEQQPVGDGELFATHSGTWEFFGHKIRCYRLNNGQTVLHAEDVEKFFGNGAV